MYENNFPNNATGHAQFICCYYNIDAQTTIDLDIKEAVFYLPSFAFKHWKLEWGLLHMIKQCVKPYGV